MTQKYLFVSQGDKFKLEELNDGSFRLLSPDLVQEIIELEEKQAIDCIIYEDFALFLHSDLNFLKDSRKPVLFTFTNFKDLKKGLNAHKNVSVSALCSKSLCQEHLNDFINIRHYIEEDLSINIKKSVHYTFNSTMEAIELATDLLEEFLKVAVDNISPIDFFQHNLILRELLTNAVKHGNKHQSDKVILLSIFSDKDKGCIGFAVKDEGEGFDFDSSLKVTQKDELRINERGLFLINEFCGLIHTQKSLIITEMK